ncbi:MAG: hypothetical protein ACRCYZ_01260 [Alphaproteobacteria bacterium]
MRKLLFLSMLLGSFYITQEAVASNICYYGCNKKACKIKEIQDICLKICDEKDVKNCSRQEAKFFKDLPDSEKTEICKIAFNRGSCKVRKIREFAAKSCTSENRKHIKNCLAAGG